jgi:hypothetical protein
MSDDNKDIMNRHAVISESAYMVKNTDRMNHINQFYPDEYELITEHTDKTHIAVKHKPSNKIILGIRGTDFENKFGHKKADLKTDGFVTLGLTKTTDRYKKSDKKLKNMIGEYGKDNLSITGHSLGGTITSNLVLKHGVEGHSFNRGGTHASFGKSLKALHPTYQKRAEKNKVYFSRPSVSRGVDPLSVGTIVDPLAKVQFVDQKKLSKEQKGVIGAHSISHFTPDKRGDEMI